MDDDLLEDARKEKFVIWHNYGNEKFSVQIAFNTKASNSNNSYLVIVSDKKDEIVAYFGFPSYTKYPPVWNREYGFIDYTDFLGIQKVVNKHLEKVGEKVIDYDLSLENRAHYYTAENPEQIEKLINEGQCYQIISIFANKKPELAAKARELVGV